MPTRIVHGLGSRRRPGRPGQGGGREQGVRLHGQGADVPPASPPRVTAAPRRGRRALCRLRRGRGGPRRADGQRRGRAFAARAAATWSSRSAAAAPCAPARASRSWPPTAACSPTTRDSTRLPSRRTPSSPSRRRPDRAPRSRRSRSSPTRRATSRCRSSTSARSRRSRSSTASLMETLPAWPALVAGMDALAHALDALWSIGATEFSDGLAATSAATIFETLPDGGAHGRPRRQAAHARGQLDREHGHWDGPARPGSRAVAAAGPLHMSHGLATGIMLPYTMEFNLPVAAAQDWRRSRGCWATRAATASWPSACSSGSGT